MHNNKNPYDGNLHKRLKIREQKISLVQEKIMEINADVLDLAPENVVVLLRSLEPLSGWSYWLSYLRLAQAIIR